MAASREELEGLIRAADAAGDADSVRVLFGEMDKLSGPKRFGTGKSFDVTPDGTLVPSDAIHYTGSGYVSPDSGIAQREKKYGTTAGFDFNVRPEDVRDVKQSLASPVRGVIKGINSLPTMAADAGVGARNLLTGSNYELPSQMYEREVFNRYLPQHDLPINRQMEFLSSIAGGMKMPVPQVKNPAPASFVKPSPDLVRQQTFEAGRNLGLVAPPSTMNPTGANTFMESLGGKIATGQDASLRNQNAFNAAAKRVLGLSEDAPLTQESLSAVRKEAGDAYKVMRAVGSVSVDEATAKSLDGVAAKFTGSELKNVLSGGNDIGKIVQTLKNEQLTGDTAVDAIALLRDKADAAYRAGSKELGKAYKNISQSIEGLMEKSLSGEALQKFKDARQLIAKSYSVESAFNPSTGNIVGTKLGTQLSRGKPLSGELKTLAQFAQAFPKAARETVDSGSVNNISAAASSGAAVLTGQPWWLGYPFLRQGMRSFLLSDAGQKLAMPSQGGQGIPPEVAMMLLGAGEQGRQRNQ